MSLHAVTVSRDGQRALIVEYPYAAGQTLHVLTNLHERIKQPHMNRGDDE
jgi:hypothetical protein